MMTVHNILAAKGSSIWTVSPNSTVWDALKLMAEKNIGAVLVMEGVEVAGMFSERDYARKVVLKGLTSQQTFIRDVMSTDVVSIRSNQSIEDCMTLMTARKIRHLPVIDGKSLSGMISIGDVVKAIISDKQETIDQLHNYITGKR
jgi:CBS domain-containing protein